MNRLYVLLILSTVLISCTKNINIVEVQEIEYTIDSEIRTSIMIFKDSDIYYSNFDVKGNIVPSNLTAYIAPDGSHDADGKTPLTPVKTLQEAKNTGAKTIIFLPGTYTANTHYSSDEDISDLNLIGVGNVVIDNMNLLPIKVTGSCYIENITFVNGIEGSLRCYIENNTSVVTCYKCVFNYSTGASSLGGFRAQGGNYYMIECEASYNYYDGFNYHKTNNGYIPHVTEINCKGFFNGSLPVESDYYSDNGSTIHDGAKAIRLNCEYGYCRGGIIADVNPGTVSYNIGCIAYSSTIKDTNLDFSANYYCGTSATMYLIGCKSHGSVYDISVSSKGQVITDNTFTNNYNNGGTIENN
ncbi:MAG: hypothetical protein ACRC3Z_09720 [Phocaeicola sp.]